MELGLEAHNGFGTVNSQKAWDTGQICVSAKIEKSWKWSALTWHMKIHPVRGKRALIKADDIKKLLLYNFFIFQEN